MLAKVFGLRVLLDARFRGHDGGGGHDEFTGIDGAGGYDGFAGIDEAGGHDEFTGIDGASGHDGFARNDEADGLDEVDWVLFWVLHWYNLLLAGVFYDLVFSDYAYFYGVFVF